jgi:hypothetical protein
MAFGYEYLMVFLPEVCPSSFLLFVHNPAGSTKLRDYSSGTERQLGIGLSVATVTSQTETELPDLLRSEAGAQFHIFDASPILAQALGRFETGERNTA